jgi:error-prone DNA polymerase
MYAQEDRENRRFILAGGVLQVQDNVIHVKVAWLRPLSDQALEVQSHDFH